MLASSKTIRGKWVLGTKLKLYGIIDKYKPGFMAKGFKQKQQYMDILYIYSSVTGDMKVKFVN